MDLHEFEEGVFSTEGFKIRVVDQDSGRDIRDDRSGFQKHGYERKARDNWTVDKWKRKRFSVKYSNFDVEVLDSSETSVPGQMKLKNVRSTYK